MRRLVVAREKSGMDMGMFLVSIKPAKKKEINKIFVFVYACYSLEI